MKNKKGIERLVVKVGTGFLFDRLSDGKYFLKEDQMDAIVQEASIISDKKELIIVSSGAVASAAWNQGLKEIPEDDYEKAQLSGEGQYVLMNQYAKRFSGHRKICAQVLISGDDLEISKRRRNLRKNQEGWLRKGVIAIYNENDPITIDEITFGDNDILAANLARTMDADLLVMLSNPQENLGTGGGESKIRARKILSKEGIDMAIINGQYEKENDIYRPKIREVLGFD